MPTCIATDGAYLFFMSLLVIARRMPKKRILHMIVETCDPFWRPLGCLHTHYPFTGTEPYYIMGPPAWPVLVAAR